MRHGNGDTSLASGVIVLRRLHDAAAFGESVLCMIRLTQSKYRWLQSFLHYFMQSSESLK